MTSDQKQDREANQFAMCLLMPKHFILKEVKHFGGIENIGDDEIKTLAEKFQVSISAMAIRLQSIYSQTKGRR